MAAALKKGSLVRAIAEQLQGSVELLASDGRIPSYVLETNGEILDIKGDYALVRFSRPTPNVWLRLDQLQSAA
ncbi:NAD(P)H-quinone oxidoreductase subunit O [Synechococcus elongatus]|uniref:NAD(P)H-quinone oxidoreductase subunit O n=2 Tax=Synechococcus elongatus TaxID=32046 RepID=NDHO_SYNE7|nr:NAD(P)H-quinone oxidoreductase subunit O [Synechococcus elongatus]Q5N1L1.1 RecName: Full=NAD(P)H-quinone oxidoreductase subunit O; AltName: Full=NAD(P)H dehydrogenase I subunit O; AltName: Full=NDH-1 subunit O; AltName: Full=NDH-O [Synechococcus elongatus PCC 6301]Q8GIT3.1 RecName: Full=NAD(P)H-quinone oxidoreductase subunit O; AltName: Full=NAD(P)H dehydrogenase I subunit O; AltName: Full=NDH-1 subunit O; AltName: Full=NDH-O [Synechococcus elongatus PCC 7942 = FACHB-805]AAN71777.1 unknown [S